MRGVRIRSAVFAAVAAVTLALAAGVVEAAPVTYNYVGNNFNFCGFGCPDNLPPGVTVTPGQGEAVDISDHIVASLTFADALPFDPANPNRVYDQSELPAVQAWSIGLASGLSVSGTTFGPFPPYDDGGPQTLPPLSLSTDAAGNIVNYVMAVHVIPHLFAIMNPPITVQEDEDTFTFSDAVTAFFARDPGGSEEEEFDVFGSIPGHWTRVTTDVPEPGTLLLLGSGVVLLGFRRLRAGRR